MQNGLTVELVTFKLNEGADEAAFLQAADAVMADIRQLPGYVRRELLKGDDGQWIDVVHWRSRNDALAAAELFNTLPSAQAFGSFLDAGTIAMLHPAQALVWGN